MIGLIGVLMAVCHADAQISIQAHHRSVVGNTIQLKIAVLNPDNEPIEFPDLSNRPWHVRFNTTDPQGQRRQLFATPPPEDTDASWTIAPGERREALFDVPTSASWSVGRATVDVVVNGHLISTQAFELFELKPDHTDTKATPIDQIRGPIASLFAVHNKSTTELWLSRSGRVDFLAEVSGKIQPELSIARADRHIGRWITWADAQGQLWGLQAELREVREAPILIRLPWPTATRCGRAGTDAKARLVMPICIAGPSGQTTQVAAAIVSGQKPPVIRAIARFKPNDVLTNVDAAGNVDFVLVRDKAIDIAHIEAGQGHSRPSGMRQLWRGDAPIDTATLTMSSTGPAVQFQQVGGAVQLIELHRREPNTTDIQKKGSP